jgi:adenylate kinase
MTYDTIAIIGAQGSGKTTQLNLMLPKIDAYSASVGQILRDNLKLSDKPEHIQAVADMKAGRLTDNKVTDSFLMSYLEEKRAAGDIRQYLVFDGYPRSLEQVESLLKLGQAYHGKPPQIAVIKFDVTHELAKKRCMDRAESNRAAGKEVRSDDTEEGITQRLSIYYKELDSILSALKDLGATIHSFDGSDTIEAIHQKVMAEIFGK